MSATLILGPEQVAQAKALRENEDKSYADIAQALGFERDDWPHVRDAVKGEGDYAPPAATPNALDALVAKAHEKRKTLIDEEGNPDIAAARKDRDPGPEDSEKIERAYNGGIGFEEIAAALDPPVHWLTVMKVLNRRGCVEPGIKMPTYDATSEEGAVQLQRDLRSGALQPLMP